jgi:hypothetical protein
MCQPASGSDPRRAPRTAVGEADEAGLADADEGRQASAGARLQRGSARRAEAEPDRVGEDEQQEAAAGADAVAADAAYLVHHKQLTADQAKRLVDFATKAQATLRGRRYVSGTLLEAIGLRYFDALPLRAARQALGKANYDLRVPSP